jgi:cell wall-associated NlpC family hydrolase
MKKIAIMTACVIVVIGCQGKPRYGGGHHTVEGDHAVEVSRERPEAADVSGDYVVDPLEMGRIIDRYLGRPYAGKGVDQKGYDCSEFVCAVYQDYASLHLPRTTENMFKAGRSVKTGDLYFGDLVFFDTGGRGVSHVGIYIGFDEFVHASTSNGIVISNLNEDYYKKRYLGARRVME